MLNVLPARLAAAVLTVVFIGSCTDGSPRGAASKDPAPAVSSPTEVAQAPADGASEANQAEIERVLAEGRRANRTSRDPDAVVAAEIRCAEFEGERFCLQLGWTTRSEASARAEVVRILAAEAKEPDVEETGDLSMTDQLAQHRALSPPEREAAERQQLSDAVGAVETVKQLRRDKD